MPYLARHRQHGFSIVELMVAVALSLLLMAGLASVYLSNKTTFKVSEGLARIQENSRYMHYILSKDIRMTGYQGCSNTGSTQVLNIVSTPAPNVSLSDQDSIKGYGYTGTTWSPALPAALTGKVLAGTDVIDIHKASELGAQLTANMAQTNTPILVADRLGIKKDDILIITDCQEANLFQAGAASSATAITHTVATNTTNDLSKAYQTDAIIYQYEAYYYYVKDTGRTNSAANAIYSLFRQDVNGVEEELVEGVENMQITYGVDTTNDKSPDTYSTATTVEASNNWPKVVSVKIALLLNSIEDINPKSQSYTYNGTTTTPTDKLLRRTLNIYIKLRNRGI